MSYVLSVVVADTSSLSNRALAFAYTSSPYIATAFAGPAAAESFYNTSGWRWAFGCFTIITPVISLPIFAILWLHQRKAVKLGVLVRQPSGRTIFQSIWHYFIEFDGKLWIQFQIVHRVLIATFQLSESSSLAAVSSYFCSLSP
jgi:MFS family permease